MALYTCTKCGKKVPAQYEICPFCRTPRPSLEVPEEKPPKKKKKKRGILGTVLIVFGVLIVLGIIFGGQDDGPKKVGDASTSQGQQSKSDEADQSSAPDKSEEPESTTFGVGDKVSLNDIIVTLNSVTESDGKQFFTPGEGNVFILCEFTIENNSTKELNISSMLCFDAYVDDYTTTMSISAQASTDKGQLDGTVAAGKKMNGVIGYEVAEDWKELEIHFAPDFWSGKDIVFVASK